MFDQLGLGEVGVLLLLALMVFGPDRLPVIARDVARGISRGRATLRRLTDDVQAGLGPELGDLAGELRALRPADEVSPSGGR